MLGRDAFGIREALLIDIADRAVDRGEQREDRDTGADRDGPRQREGQGAGRCGDGPAAARHRVRRARRNARAIDDIEKGSVIWQDPLFPPPQTGTALRYFKEGPAEASLRLRL